MDLAAANLQQTHIYITQVIFRHVLFSLTERSDFGFAFIYNYNQHLSYNANTVTSSHQSWKIYHIKQQLEGNV